MRESIYKHTRTKENVAQAKIDKFNRKSKVRVYTMENGKIKKITEGPANEMKAAERARIDDQYNE